MKVYIQGIIFGILSVISGLMMSGIPLGSEMIEIANLFILVIGVFAVFFVGVFKKKYNVAAYFWPGEFLRYCNSWEKIQ